MKGYFLINLFLRGSFLSHNLLDLGFVLLKKIFKLVDQLVQSFLLSKWSMVFILLFIQHFRQKNFGLKDYT